MKWLLLFLCIPLFAQTPDDVLNYWFGENPIENPAQNARMWFVGGALVDEEIRSNFGELYKEARFGRLNEWKKSARGRLALILLLDQFPRNIYRGSGEAFLTDALALALVLEGLELGHDRELTTIERFFFYIPAMHSEDLGLQQLSVVLFTRLLAESDEMAREQMERSLDFAKLHLQMIETFGRFPSRNVALSRLSSNDELAYLSTTPPF